MSAAHFFLQKKIVEIHKKIPIQCSADGSEQIFGENVQDDFFVTLLDEHIGFAKLENKW